MKAVVYGSGAWGTALALLLLENGHEVTLWSFSAEEIRVMEERGENPMLVGVPLPKELNLTNDLSVGKDCDLMVLATPSFAVASTAKQIADLLPAGAGRVLVTVSKGIERDTGFSMSQIIERETGDKCRVVALSGPSHAEEVGRRIPTGCVSASKDEEAALFVQDAFMNQRFRVYASPDIVGVELAAALKNVIALCAGVCDGFGGGDNTKAMLMTRGLAEIARLGVAMGGCKETFAGLAGVGDLIVTCTSMHSRNRRAGILIGQGKDPQTAIKEIGAVVEGYFATESAYFLAKKLNVEMPITEAAYRVLYENAGMGEALQVLMNRDKKREIDEGWL